MLESGGRSNPSGELWTLPVSRPKQNVVPVDIVPEQCASPRIQKTYMEDLYTIEISVKDIIIRISNDTDPAIIARIFRLLQEFSY